jgi:UDP:flavonoid glycosyltransferase YjiC (YdhE family)
MALDKRPDLKKVPFVMIYDFVGLDAMSRNPLERLITYQGNWAWVGGPRGKPPTQQDLTLFIGEPEDVPDKPFGFLLPNRREYARRYYHFVGYTFPFDPADYAEKKKMRSALGYDEERPLVICSVGGTAVGVELLRLCATSYPHIQERVGDAHMVLVCGPRIDPASVQAPSGVEVRGYVPRLYEHLAASDVAIVQGGETTTLELTALRTPFIYFPLEGHFEQNLVVAKRLARHRAGERLLYSKTTSENLAEAAVAQLGREATWPPIPTDGARRSAELINQLLVTRAPMGSAR